MPDISSRMTIRTRQITHNVIILIIFRVVISAPNHLCVAIPAVHYILLLYEDKISE